MNEINKTLYIPLFAKSFVSQKGIIINDKKAEEIWEKEGFELSEEAKSKWLCYYLATRARVFDDWTNDVLRRAVDTVVIHIGCGLDNRINRTQRGHEFPWYDVDMTEAIDERKKYFEEDDNYHMISGNIRDLSWLEQIGTYRTVVVIMEGISMYITNEELNKFFKALDMKFIRVKVLLDAYTDFGVRMSKHKNPIKEVGVQTVYAVEDPRVAVKGSRITYLVEHFMIPDRCSRQLKGWERFVFKHMYNGMIAKKIYRVYEYLKLARDHERLDKLIEQ